MYSLLGPEDVSLLERCPHFRRRYVQASMELGPEDVSLLERCPHFRGCYEQASMELGPEDVSPLERCVYIKFCSYLLQCRQMAYQNLSQLSSPSPTLSPASSFPQLSVLNMLDSDNSVQPNSSGRVCLILCNALHFPIGAHLGFFRPESCANSYFTCKKV